MLELRPSCECCDRARICSFECTFCRSCAEGVLSSVLVARPRRPADELARHKPTGCA